MPNFRAFTPEIKALHVHVCTLFAEVRRRDTRAGTTTNVQIVLNRHNTLYLNNATP